MSSFSLSDFVLRPARAGDLDQVERIAAKTAVGITSMPPNRARLADKITASEHSFAAEVDLPGEETYFFVLENHRTGEIVGTSGIAASAGFHDRFYSYRNEIIVHASQELKVSNKIHALHLCHDLTGDSLLTSFYIEPAYAQTALPQLLSRARLLFIAEHGARFSDKLAAENPGLCDSDGQSPFWNAVGRRFFNMEYPQAEQLSGGRSKTFIAELMPQYPIYVPLLPADAKLAIGQLHPDAELPFSILVDEGFEADTYIDIFDGGPTVEARIQTLRTIRDNRRVECATGEPDSDAPLAIVANTECANYRAVLTPCKAAAARRVEISAEAAASLRANTGSALRVVPLAYSSAEGEGA